MTPREQNSLVTREQNTLSMKMCMSAGAGIASLDDVSRVKNGACAVRAHQAAALGLNFLF